MKNIVVLKKSDLYLTPSVINTKHAVFMLTYCVYLTTNPIYLTFNANPTQYGASHV